MPIWQNISNTFLPVPVISITIGFRIVLYHCIWGLKNNQRKVIPRTFMPLVYLWAYFAMKFSIVAQGL